MTYRGSPETVAAIKKALEKTGVENASAPLAPTVTGPGSVMSSLQSVMRCKRCSQKTAAELSAEADIPGGGGQSASASTLSLRMGPI